MTKYIILSLLLIDFGLSQISIKGKQVYNHEINEYYSYNEFIEILNSDKNFVNYENFINFRFYVNNIKSKRSMSLYCLSLSSIGAGLDPENPTGAVNLAMGVLLPISYYTYYSHKREEALFYVIQEYNNIYSNGDINYEGYPGPKLVEAYEKATPQQQVFGACVGGVIIINLIWRWMWRDYY